MSSGAKRQRAYRERQRSGQVVLLVPVDLQAITAMLERTGRLKSGQDHDREEVEGAVAGLLESLCRRPSGARRKSTK